MLTITKSKFYHFEKAELQGYAVPVAISVNNNEVSIVVFVDNKIAIVLNDKTGILLTDEGDMEIAKTMVGI